MAYPCSMRGAISDLFILGFFAINTLRNLLQVMENLNLILILGTRILAYSKWKRRIQLMATPEREANSILEPGK